MSIWSCFINFWLTKYNSPPPFGCLLLGLTFRKAIHLSINLNVALSCGITLNVLRFNNIRHGLTRYCWCLPTILGLLFPFRAIESDTYPILALTNNLSIILQSALAKIRRSYDHRHDTEYFVLSTYHYAIYCLARISINNTIT